MKAGQAVPLKFSLHGNQGLSIFSVGSPTSQAIVAPAGVSSDPVPTDTAGSSSLSYDSSSDSYAFVWKTDRSWAGTTRQFVMQLNDGATIYRANFSFTK